jgi:hypothetical protein
MKPRINVKAADDTEMNNRESRDRKIACNFGKVRAGRGLKWPGKKIMSAPGKRLRFTSAAVRAAGGFCGDAACAPVVFDLADTGLLPVL